MGRKCFESLPGLLPNRKHIILTNNKDYQVNGAIIFHTKEEVLDYLKNAEEELDIDTAKKLSAILKDVSGIIKSLDMAMKQAKAEQAEAGRVKGGGIIGMYE